MNSPADPSPKPVKRLWRSRSNRVFGGVCGGLAEYLGVNATAVRLVWLIFALFGGSGIIAYLLALIIVPNVRGPSIPQAEDSGRWRLIIGVILAFFGVMLIMGNWVWPAVWDWHPWRRVILPASLILAGIAMIVLKPKKEAAPNVASTPVESIVSNRPPFRRSRRNRIIFGICGGLAEHWNVDTALVRLGWALGTLLTDGLGLFVYLLLLIVIPIEPPPRISPTSDAGG